MDNTNTKLKLLGRPPYHHEPPVANHSDPGTPQSQAHAFTNGR